MKTCQYSNFITSFHYLLLKNSVLNNLGLETKIPQFEGKPTDKIIFNEVTIKVFTLRSGKRKGFSFVQVFSSQNDTGNSN